MQYNKVIDRVLEKSGMSRNQIYVTQAFHLLPATRSAHIPYENIDRSFKEVTFHELNGRYVIALGGAATNACRKNKIDHVSAVHPSARHRTYEDKAQELADLIRQSS